MMKWKGDKVIKAVNQGIEKALTSGALLVEAEAVLRAPVDTGNLRSSITHRVDGEEATIGTNVEYAPAQEYKYNPFLRPALDENKTKLQKLMGDIIGDAIRR